MRPINRSRPLALEPFIEAARLSRETLARRRHWSPRALCRRRSTVPPPILVRHTTPELRVVVSNVSSPFSPPLSLCSARLSSPSPPFRSSPPRAPVRPSPRPPNPKMSSPSLALSPRPNRARTRARSADFSNSGNPRHRLPSHVVAGSAQRRAESPLRSTSHISVCSRASPPAEPRADARAAPTYSAPSDQDPTDEIQSSPSQSKHTGQLPSVLQKSPSNLRK